MGPLKKFFKNTFFYVFLKNSKEKALSFLLVKNMDKDFSCIKPWTPFSKFRAVELTILFY